MKRLLIAFIVVCILGILGFFAYHNLPRLCSYALGRMTDSSVAISGIDIDRVGAAVRVSFHDVSLDGSLKGTIKDAAFVLDIAKGIYFKDITLSGFRIVSGPTKTKGRYFTFPAESLEIRNGVLIFNNEEFFVDSIELNNVNLSGKPLSFRATIRNNRYFRVTDLQGGGIYRKDLIDVKGTVGFKSVDLASLQGSGGSLKGSVNGEGTFTYKDAAFTFKGKVEATGYEMRESWLRRPLVLERLGGEVSLTAKGDTVDIVLRRVMYKKTPFALDIHLEKMDITRLELTSGFVPAEDISHYATADYSLQTLWDALGTGGVRARRLLYDDKKGVTADLETKGLTLAYEDMHFSEMDGFVSIDMQKVAITGMSGVYRGSRFYEVSGVIPYEGEKIVDAKGKYVLSLLDMPPFVDLRGITFRAGTTEGAVEVKARRGKELDIQGKGVLRGARAMWKDASFMAEGSYRFSRRDVAFDPLVLSRDNSRIFSRGRWNDDGFDFHVNGSLDTAHLSSFVRLPVAGMSGPVQVDGRIVFDRETLSVSGDAGMDDLAFEIPGFLRKVKGVKSRGRIELTKKGSRVDINRLGYDLDIMSLRARGAVDENRTVNGDVSVEIPSIGKVAKYFYLPDYSAKGNASFGVTVKDLRLPFQRLPHVTGFAVVNDGFLRIPGLVNPVEHVNLVADFKGNSLEMELKGLTMGKSVLNTAKLRLSGLETPLFSLLIDMDKLDLGDFKSHGDKPFRIPLIPQGSLLSRAGGDVSLKTKEFVVNNVTGKNLEMNAFVADRKISFSESRLDIFDGSADVRGIVDLSGRTPYLYTSSRLVNAKSDIFFSAFGTTPREISGKTFIQGTLKSEGAVSSEIISNLDGNVIIYNSDGVIKKWRFLAKLFSVLNLYDLIKGKINFAQSGLAYRKMGAAFSVKKGILRSGNFLLDSPSMIITGDGQIDLNKEEINGTLHVSPLIAIDRTLDKIPILRSILKKPGQGLLYLSYEVKGSLDDPQITPSLTGTVSGKTIELFRNILVLPKEVFEQ